jgi:hypothetical protein
MFCALGLVFDGTVCVGSRFHDLRARTRFRRYLGHWVPFSRFALPNTFSAEPRASLSIFLFCAPGLIFGGAEGVASRFHILRSRTHFRWCRGRPVPFSPFALPDSFSAVAGAWGPVFLFYALGLVFRDTEGVPSRFHVFRSGTCFRRYRGRRVPFSCFALPDSFSVVSRASGPVFMFCEPVHVFDGTEGFESLFHVFGSRTYFRRYRGVGSHFHVLRSGTHFRRSRGHRVPFSHFALP